MSGAESARKETSYEEIAAGNAQRYKRMMCNSLITAGVCATLAGVGIYSLITFSFPTYGFVLLIIFLSIAVLVGLVYVHDAGRFSEIKDYSPLLCIKEGEYRELKKNYDEHVDMSRWEAWSLSNHIMSLQFFLHDRYPGALAEFAALRRDKQQSDVVDKKEVKLKD